MRTVYSDSLEHTSACILHTKIESTGLCGGDSGHGGYVVIEFKDHGGVDMSCEHSDGHIKIKFGGDCEISALSEALSFLDRRLKTIISRSKNEPPN